MPRQLGGYCDRDAEVRQLAAGMRQREQQVVAENAGIGDHDLMEQMAAFLAGLHLIWTITTDDTLSNLCSEYRAFLRYAKVMEGAFATCRSNSSASHFGPDFEPLPDRPKPILARVISQCMTLEREPHGSVDAFQRHAAVSPNRCRSPSVRHRQIPSTARRHQQ